MSNYYGELAIHFRGGSRPLLVSIDEDNRRSVSGQLYSDGQVLVFETLDNRTMVVRKAAIADLHLSCEGTGLEGPEPTRYRLPVRDVGTCEDTDFTEPEDGGMDPVDALVGRMEHSGSEFWQAVQAGLVHDGVPEHLQDAIDCALDSPQRRSYELLASYAFWQVEGCPRRGMFVSGNADAVAAFIGLMAGEEPLGGFVYLPNTMEGGYYHLAAVPLDALEYMSFPSHQLEAHVAGLTE